MPWFKVDDSFHTHPKVLATKPAALGLWVVAGSWSSAHLTEGWVPDDVLPRLLPDAATLARTLVAAGLWLRKRGGYQFHDWLDKNPSRQAVENDRAKRAERQRRWREGQRRRVTNPSTNGVSNAAPDPTRPEIGGEGVRAGRRRVKDSPCRPVPAWCGQCDSPDTRMVEAAGDTVVRCPRCHPSARAG